ncbi:ParB/RepB/Spo0J family partition protein [Lichenihabitans sp. Uapishka_5]|uniref:ParB/RepB/Spo0J family partition protein n=1 Tax=Lichenihabitans sp. Uapishka_5 TaxID=3037302 RepID=UPI0029E81734|nr:ParB/RepB/Spo0J family partition protein [Lichenihabitans sp. Uapishka_5]MDX7952078.1 ParB/RepB/Spo0J family partition protein [Lichenihabitans sp. Uapishka_5]
MAEDAPRPRLGRGLAALLADTSAQMPALVENTRDRARLPVSALEPNPRNPRHDFDAAELDDLAGSIREKGILQPIIVRPSAGAHDRYEIIAGERRWRAAQLAGLNEVPVIVVAASDGEALELAIIENVQRTDLNAIEEARGYERLSHEFGYSQSDLARIIGKSRSHVANTVRLLKLPEPVSRMVSAGQITAGHARALLAFDDPEAVARRVVQRGLNVREVEQLAQRQAEKRAGHGVDVIPPKPARRSGEAVAVAEELSTLLGLAVTLDHRGGGGELRIRYNTLEQLHGLCRQLRS